VTRWLARELAVAPATSATIEPASEPT
jgi:hypothetical protein